MRIEICIAKEKMTKMPNGAVDALKEELTRRKIGNGWKSFNTRTIESSLASRGTFLHTMCYGFIHLRPETSYTKSIRQHHK